MPSWPHDDTQSLVKFYGKPGDTSQLVLVKPPWQMTFEGRPIQGVKIHRKCAASLKRVFDDIAEQVDNDWSRLPRGAKIFDGSYNYRPIRGGSRPSCHSFGAAIDLDAEQNPLGSTRGTMSPIVINAFKREGWYWGGNFKSRKDMMHFQAANEDVQVASLDDSVGIAEMPPETDGHDDSFEREEEAQPAQSTSIIESLPTVGAVAGAVGTTATIADNVNTIVTKVKPITKSHISIGAAALGASSTATAVAAAPPTLLEQFVNVWKSPIWWLVVLNLALTIYIVAHYYFDHGKGALRKANE